MEPKIDFERRTFTTRNGTELQLRPISSLILERLSSDKSGKPKVPRVEVTIGGSHTRLEDNPNDPEYVRALAEWNKESSMRLVKYVFVHGVANSPPDAFVEEHVEYFPDASERDIKYLWIGSLVDEYAEDIKLLVQTITGQTSITEEGLEQAIASFPRDGGRDERGSLEPEQAAGFDSD